MKRLFSIKTLAAAGVAACALAAAGTAQARSDVYFSIGVSPAYVQPAPVYVSPPVYGYAYGYAQPQPYYEAAPIYYYENDQWRHRRHAHRYGPYGDLDHDGVPNRFDRAPTNPYRR